MENGSVQSLLERARDTVNDYGGVYMGSKVEAVKTKSIEGKEAYEKANEQGREVVDKVQQLNECLRELPQDVDEELLEAAENAKREGISEAIQDMETNVKTVLEEGKAVMQEASNEANEQISKNEQVKETFESMDSIADYGSGARATGRSTIDSITQEFNQTLADNEELTSAAEEEFEREIEEIQNSSY